MTRIMDASGSSVPILLCVFGLFASIGCSRSEPLPGSAAPSTNLVFDSPSPPPEIISELPEPCTAERSRIRDLDVEAALAPVDPNAPRASLYEDLARCEDSAGHLTDSIRHTQRALEHGIRERNVEIITTSRSRLATLLTRIPHVTFDVENAPDVRDLEVMFDGRPVPNNAFTKKFSVDPGDHFVETKAVRRGRVVRHLNRVHLGESELVAVHVTPE